MSALTSSVSGLLVIKAYRICRSSSPSSQTVASLDTCFEAATDQTEARSQIVRGEREEQQDTLQQDRHGLTPRWPQHCGSFLLFAAAVSLSSEDSPPDVYSSSDEGENDKAGVGGVLAVLVLLLLLLMKDERSLVISGRFLLSATPCMRACWMDGVDAMVSGSWSWSRSNQVCVSRLVKSVLLLLIVSISHTYLHTLQTCIHHSPPGSSRNVRLDD